MSASASFESGYRHGRQLEHFRLDVTAYGRENLARALGLAFSSIVQGENQATHYAESVVNGRQRLTLFECRPWDTVPAEASAFPSPISSQQAMDFVCDWLQRVPYQNGDSHDGGQDKGWRVFNELYGIVGGCWEAFVAIEPMWIYIPK
jgi:hypothetical protein